MTPLKSLSLQKLAKICRDFLKNKKIEDIIIIGSFLKGEDIYHDIDLIFIFSKFEEKVIKDAYKFFEKKEINAHISKTKYSYLMEDPSLWNTIIHEGYSVKKCRLVSEIFSIMPYLLYKFDLKNLNTTQKQSFSHALYGTGGRESILNRYKGLKISSGAILSPMDKSENFREFIEAWGLNYKATRIWM